eukprot:364555-Chlamydomonas_euryale.AAC.17
MHVQHGKRRGLEAGWGMREACMPCSSVNAVEGERSGRCACSRSDAGGKVRGWGRPACYAQRGAAHRRQTGGSTGSKRTADGRQRMTVAARG